MRRHLGVCFRTHDGLFAGGSFESGLSGDAVTFGSGIQQTPYLFEHFVFTAITDWLGALMALEQTGRLIEFVQPFLDLAQ